MTPEPDTTAARAPAPPEGASSVLTAVLANRFETIVREMTNTLFRAGRSSVLNTARDFSCCVVTADDQLLAAAEGLQVARDRRRPADASGWGACTRTWPRATPTSTTTPTSATPTGADHTLLVPVYIDGEHFLTVSAKAHQADCGNSAPSTYMPFATDVYEEGLLTFPCVRVQRDYSDVEDIIRMCRARIRVPDVWYGDYLAAIGAVRVGERRVKELVDKYGIETVREFIADWLDYSERRMTGAIRELPACRLQASSTHDLLPGDDEQVTVNVTIDIDPAEGRIEVDLRDNVDCRAFGPQPLRELRDGRRHGRRLQLPAAPTCPTTPAAFAASTCSCARDRRSAASPSPTRPRWRPPTCSTA